jgi:RimJ/RimL family protein N-acetyltransferase
VPVFQTDRLVLSEFSLADTTFIIQLTNTEGWLRNIGDRYTKTEAGAIAYLQKGPLKSYATTGYGLWKTSLKETGQDIGICGCFKRDIFDHPDIGYALLPAFEGKGYATEAATGSRDFLFANYAVNNLLGITEPENLPSLKILSKLGMEYRKDISMPNETEVLKLYSIHPL